MKEAMIMPEKQLRYVLKKSGYVLKETESGFFFVKDDMPSMKESNLSIFCLKSILIHGLFENDLDIIYKPDEMKGFIINTKWLIPKFTKEITE
jgi:hypothetical protein